MKKPHAHLTDSLRSSAVSTPAGVDFGTTFSRVAYVDHLGKVHVVRFPYGIDESGSSERDAASAGGIKAPSALFVGRDAIQFGAEALSAARDAPQNFAECFKRDLGRPHYGRQINGFRVPPEILGGLLLERLREDAQAQVGPLRDAVFTVPAYFADVERTAARQAGALAGWNVTAVLNEPSAAAIAHVFGELASPRQTTAASRKILVYDFGGGTFDASLVSVEGRSLRTVATSGEIRLGGRDLDARLAAFLADEFQGRHGVDLRAIPTAWRRVEEIAHRAKHALSRESDCRVELRHDGLAHAVEISRAKFNQLVGALIFRTIDTCRDVLEAAKVRWDDLDEVVLVGGSSRVAAVREKLRSVAGAKVHLSNLADELVVRGAALYAASRGRHPLAEAEGRLDVINVNSHSLGLASRDRATNQWVNRIILPRNTPLPATVRPPCELFRDHQKRVPIHLLEGESDNPNFCAELGVFVVNITRPLPKGTRIDVACEYDAEGNISVSARVADSRDANHIFVSRQERNPLASLDVWRHRLLKGSDPPAALAAPPAARSRDPHDADELVARLDELYGYLGRLGSSLALPIGAVAAARLAKMSSWELEYARQTVADLTRKAGRQGTSPELSASIVRAKMEVERASAAARHACIALGREFIAAQLAPPGAESYTAEIRRLQSRLDELC